MSIRYQNCFQHLSQNKQGAFVPFVMLGDPNLEQSYAIIIQLIESGADALELGIPFSDPSADGVVIQAAALRALSASVNVDKCLQLVTDIRQDYPDLPIGLLLYANLVVSRGIESFYLSAATAGVDSILIADVPLLESQPFVVAAKQNQIAPIFIAPPNASPEILSEIACNTKGYTYLLSRAGVTGNEVEAAMPAQHIIQHLKDLQAPPCLLGFGISQPEQVSQAIVMGADGVISGSAVVQIISQNLAQPLEMLNQLDKFVQKMKQATFS